MVLYAVCALQNVVRSLFYKPKTPVKMKKLNTGVATYQKGKRIIVLDKEELKQRKISQDIIVSNMIYAAMIISGSIITGMLFLTLF